MLILGSENTKVLNWKFCEKDVMLRYLAYFCLPCIWSSLRVYIADVGAKSLGL
jgi:hypothetical protein